MNRSGHGIDLSAIVCRVLEDWTRVCPRLDPWPDAVEGLTRLKARFPIVTLSNGNVAIMLGIARHRRLPWDAILGAEVTRLCKPLIAAYTRTAEILDLPPHQRCLVAAHHTDLAAARGAGLATAYVDRPMERGEAPAPDRQLAQYQDWHAGSLIDLAEQLAC